MALFQTEFALFRFSNLFHIAGILEADIGIDSEYIRYAIQDIFIHDMYFIPKIMEQSRKSSLSND